MAVSPAIATVIMAAIGCQTAGMQHQRRNENRNGHGNILGP
jgi:hypothetical protein